MRRPGVEALRGRVGPSGRFVCVLHGNDGAGVTRAAMFFRVRRLPGPALHGARAPRNTKPRRMPGL
jgi:hypothetical protein